MGRKRDQFWDYAEQRLDGRFKCNFCHGDFPGGATRIKAHLARVSGHDIVACVAVPQEVQKEKEARATQETNKKLKCASSSSSAKESSASSSNIMDSSASSSAKESSASNIVTQVFV